LVPDEGDGEELFVFAEREKKRDRTGDPELVNAVRSRILESSGLTPGKVLLLEAGTLPRTSSGKIRRGETRKRFLDGTLGPPKTAGLFLIAGEVVRSKLAPFIE
jgi:acyl-CoA synthetase (AMP-forming)/AMP-acid ligase II